MNLFIAEVLIKFPKTERFCKVKIGDNHRVEAVHFSDFRWRKAEEARIAEEKRKAEEEAKLAEGEGDG